MSEADASGDGGVSRAAPERIRAAEYVRMSTDHQKYSTENQAETIRSYAEQRGFEIVRTYADEGRSGLNLAGREALRQLIADVQSGSADFKAILVYDVSRWGRFQDADESAYYEYICKRAGIAVVYCAEQFENDGSPIATIVKGVKRAMAGEYSRELSAKVFAGQCRLIEHGYRQGGPAGYGLRRALIDESGTLKGILAPGERKSIQTDRVILVPGPDEETETVRWMYRAFIEDRASEQEIAASLNSRRIRTDVGRGWTRSTVHQVLINEKYVGDNLWNRVSFKLKKKRVRNTPEMWIRATGVFEPVVDRELFQAAQRIILDRSRRLSDEDLLEDLRRLFAEKGYLSGVIIDEQEELASSSAYRHRFGSLLRAYQLIGFTPDRDYRYVEINRALRRMHPDVVTEAIARIEELGGTVICNPANDLLAINGEFTASIVIARCLTLRSGASRWKIRFDTSLRPDITVALRMDADNQSAMDYYLLPRIDMPERAVRLAEDNGLSLDAYRFDTLDGFFHLAARTSIRTAA